MLMRLSRHKRAVCAVNKVFRAFYPAYNPERPIAWLNPRSRLEASFPDEPRGQDATE
jgi:hypothetical protein